MPLFSSLDHNTISNFRRDNPQAIKKVFRTTVQIARHFELIGGKLIDGVSSDLIASTMVFGQTKSFYDFKVKTIDGVEYNLTQLKGKKVLVVNTASKCGFTPQYAELQKLYETYGGDKFIIIGFPANNFLSQEPGSNSEIKAFCTANYGVTFPMMEKISVKGNDIDRSSRCRPARRRRRTSSPVRPERVPACRLNP